MLQTLKGIDRQPPCLGTAIALSPAAAIDWRDRPVHGFAESQDPF
jgi:hypothetical protein